MTDKPRLLVVDDEPDMQRGLRRIFRSKGYEVATAASGEEAIEIARDFSPHGILMDIRMPGISGVDAYREIRKDCPNAFVVFMTAYSEFAEQAQTESLSDVLSKPVDVEALCELVEHASVNRPILIVDDDRDFGLSLQRVLASRGLRVNIACSAKEARLAYSKQPRAVVLLDMKLQEEDGIDVLHELQELNPNLAVIAISGIPGMLARMGQVLMDKSIACFEKPLDLTRLTAMLDRIAKASNKAGAE